MTFNTTDLSCLLAFACIVFLAIAWIIGKAAFWHGFEAGHIAGGNEERSHQNARMIRRKMHVHREGIKFGVEHHETLRLVHSERRES